MQEREKGAKHKLHRLGRLRRTGAKVRHIARAGITASLVWGSAENKGTRFLGVSILLLTATDEFY
eukprot:3066121-Amphidinium_carterae.1